MNPTPAAASVGVFFWVAFIVVALGEESGDQVPVCTPKPNGGAIANATPIQAVNDAFPLSTIALPPPITTQTQHRFVDAVYDGHGSVWLVPQTAPILVRVNTTTGVATPYPIPDVLAGDISVDEPNKFTSGSVVDPWRGVLWLLAGRLHVIARINISTGEMLRPITPPAFPIEATRGSSTSFWGMVFDSDGDAVWLVPHDAKEIVRVNAGTGEMRVAHTFSDEQVTGSIQRFAEGVFDDARRNVWLVPGRSTQLARLHTVTEQVSLHALGSARGFSGGNSMSYVGGAFDDVYDCVWLIPHSADAVASHHAATGHVRSEHANYPASVTRTASAKFHSGTFDGRALWLAPFSATVIVRFDTRTGQMHEVAIMPHVNTNAGAWQRFFVGASFDGARVYFSPPLA